MVLVMLVGGPRTWLPLLVMTAAFAGCSSGSNETLTSISVEKTTTTTITTTTTAPSTTTTVGPTTTLSDQATAEAEAQQVVIDWWIKGSDPAYGEVDGGKRYVTGLMAQRVDENVGKLAEQGRVLSSQGASVIEITDLEIELDKGYGVIHACHGTDTGFVDIETGEPLEEPADPNDQTTGVFTVALTPQGWKISDWYDSAATGAVECKVGNQ